MNWPDSIDFKAFAGPRAAALRLRRHPRLPVWGALFLSFAWFYWRRLYVVGSLMLMPFVLPVMFGRHPHFSGLAAIVPVLGLILPPFLARPIYALACLQRCRRADRLGLSGAARRSYLMQAGGLSWLGGLIAGTFWYVFVKALLNGPLPHGWARLLP